MKLSGETILSSVEKQMKQPLEGVILKRTLRQMGSEETIDTYTRVEEKNAHEIFDLNEYQVLVLINLGSANEVLKDDTEDFMRDVRHRALEFTLRDRGWHVITGEK